MPFGQLHQCIFSGNGVLVRLHGRRSRPENHQRIFEFPAHHGNIPRIVARRFGLFIGRVVFLIDHDQFQIPERGEERGPGADSDLDPAVLHFHPFVVAFAVAQSAVEHADLVAEPGAEPFHGLRRQRDFRHQHDRFPAFGQHFGDGLEIDFSLAAPGYTVEQDHMSFVRFAVMQFVPDQFQRGGLFRTGFLRLGRQNIRPLERIAVHPAFFGHHHSVVEQFLQSGHGTSGFPEQLIGRHAAGIAQQDLEQGAAAFGAGVVQHVAVDRIAVGREIPGFGFLFDPSAADGAGQQVPHGGFPCAAIVIRHPFAQPDQGIGQGFVVVADGQDGFQRGEGRKFGESDHVGDPFPAVAERYQDAHPDPDRIGDFRRHGVIETPVQRQIQQDMGYFRRIFHVFS